MTFLKRILRSYLANRQMAKKFAARLHLKRISQANASGGAERAYFSFICAAIDQLKNRMQVVSI